MEALLRGEKPAEIIPFSLEGPVCYYPVRHHSPACAWHLERIIEAYGPDCILVEGPENANDLIPVLTDPDTKAPLALYYTCRAVDQACCYYPFLDQSPELAALRAAARRQIPGWFIDLPYGQILLATEQARGLRDQTRKQNYASDRYLAENRFLQLLCEKAEVRDFEEFWEKYFESAGLALSDEAFVNLMNTYCLLARQHTPAERLRADGCLAREAHMAQRVAEAMQNHRRVLVVAGGFHIWGLLHPLAGMIPTEKIPAEAQAVYPMRYSLAAVDVLSGYASGMPAPGFYTDLWQAMHQGPDPWERVVLEYLVKTGRKLRAKGTSISAFDEICALEQAGGLAQLRQKAAPGLYELRDAVLSCYVKGEASLSGLEPMAVLQALTTGKTVGQLCATALVPPLTRDFEAQCRMFRLKQEAGGQREMTLSIFAEPRHREISRFLHRTVFLDCGFAKRKKGPDLVGKKDRNLIREVWDYRWSAGVEAVLIEHSVSGATVQEACATQLRCRMEAAVRAREGAQLLIQGFLMGIDDQEAELLEKMDRLLLGDGDFASLCDACASLYELQQWRAHYGAAKDDTALLRRCFARVMQLLPGQNRVDERNLHSVQQACMLLYQVTGLDGFSDQRPALLRGLETLVGKNPIHPGLHGTALGLLYGADSAWKNRIDRTIRGYLQGTRGMMLQSAAFLQGLFFTARDLLLIDSGFLRQVDALLCGLADADFQMLLPELRLAFSYFAPMETDRLAKNAAGLHGAAGTVFRREGIDPAAYSRGEALDAWAAARLDEMGPEGGEP